MQWLVLDLTDSKTLLGVVALAQGLTILFLSPWGGVVAERSSRRNLLIVGRLGLVATTAVMAGLILLGVAQVWHVVVSVVAAGAFLAFTQPATQTFLHDIVGSKQIAAAVALNASITSICMMAGPAIAGALLAAVGIAMTYLAGGAAYLIGALLMAMIPILGKTVALRKSSFVSDLKEGLAYVKTSPLTIWLMGFVLTNFFGTFINLLRPVFAKEVLNVGASGLGLLGLFYGAGAIFSSLLVSVLYPKIKRPGIALMITVSMWDLSMFLFAVSRSFPLSLFSQFLGGMCGPFYMTTTMTMLQMSTPDRVRSRVMALYFMFQQVMFFGQFAAGVVADLLGNTPSLLLGAIGQFSFVLITLLLAKSIRDFGKQPIPHPQVA
jgi:predicted MFS family arabinose efflux permease